MKSKSAQKVKLASYDDLFGISGQNPSEVITSVPINLFHTFKGHPFRELDDAKMAETVESVRKYGILIPGIVRPYPQGGYEVIAGHRRWRACELAGLEEMPVIIRDLDDDAATVIMVDTNIQMYIRLAELEKELPDYVDTCKIPLTVGEKLSYLKREEQKWAAEAIKNSGVFPSKSQAEQLKTFRQPIQKPRLFCV